MGDLISRTAALVVAENIVEHLSETTTNWNMLHRWAKQQIDAIPSVEPQIKKGKWIRIVTAKHKWGETWHYECSNCGKWSNKGYTPLEKYCGECGAEMEV